MKAFKIEIESLLQFAIGLIQLVGMFLVRPSVFDLYNRGTMFLAGDPGIYFMFLITVAFILISFTYNKPSHTKYWVIATFCTGLLFSFFLFTYNNDLRNKTFLAASASGPAAVRVIKGNEYRRDVKENCPLFTSNQPVKEMDVIQQCASIRDWSEIDTIWPKAEIEDNTNLLLADYYLCLVFGGISLICGVQAIKCKRNTK